MERRRGHNEGTLGQLSDGRWQGRISLPNGKRKAVYGKTKVETRKKMEELKYQLREGELVGKPSQKTSGYLSAWLQDHVQPSKRPKTYDSYALNVRRALPYIGHLRLDAVRADHLQHCYADLRSQGLSACSVGQLHRVLRAAFRQPMRSELLLQTPTAAVTPPRSDRRQMRPLTPEEVRVFFDATAKDLFHPLWVLLVTTGLRIGEAAALTWGDVDLAAGTLAVRRAAQRQSGRGMVFVEPKTSGSRRTVHLAQGTLDTLSKHRENQREEANLRGHVWSLADLLFPAPTGGPVDPRYVLEALHRALQAARLPVIRVHDLRHTAATYLLSQGTHPKVVQDLLGHSSITLTLDIYSQVVPALHKEAAVRMDALFVSLGEDS
ncbi:MAG: tyrosine-type recombinase/integrase [Chloroflexota bacterium]